MTFREYIVRNDLDGNDYFVIEADTAENAAWGALSELGWTISEGDEVDDTEEATA